MPADPTVLRLLQDRMLVSFVPLLLTTVCGLPRWLTMALGSLATPTPDNDVSATSPMHSRVKSPTTHRMRNRRQWRDRR